jgi:hypothetical protein
VPLLVVQAEHERPDDRPALVPAERPDDAVRRARVLDLEHRALVGGVRAVERLGDDAVEPGALEHGEPLAGRGRVAGHRREVHGRPGVGQQLLEPVAPLRLRDLHQRLAVHRQQVEGDERRGRRLGEHPHAAVGRVDALQQRLEVEADLAGDDDLAVDDAPGRQVGAHGLDDLREVARQRPLVAAAELDLVAVLEDDAAEAVPLRLVEVVPVGDVGDRLGEHRLDGRHDRQVHPGSLSHHAVPSGREGGHLPDQVGLALEADAGQVGHGHVPVHDLDAVREAAEGLEQVGVDSLPPRPSPAAMLSESWCPPCGMQPAR